MRSIRLTLRNGSGKPYSAQMQYTNEREIPHEVRMQSVTISVVDDASGCSVSIPENILGMLMAQASKGRANDQAIIMPEAGIVMPPMNGKGN